VCFGFNRLKKGSYENKESSVWRKVRERRSIAFVSLRSENREPNFFLPFFDHLRTSSRVRSSSPSNAKEYIYIYIYIYLTEMSNRLPCDLQNEILVRLPVKSLLRFQCVCKSWKSFFSSPRFIFTHTQYSESTDNYAHLLHWQIVRDGVRQYQVHRIDGSFNEFQNLEYPYKIRGREYSSVLECKGLILFTTTMIKDEIDDHAHGFEPLILWNPAIRMSITLPRPCIDVPAGSLRVHGFGFDHKSNDYKVVRIVYERYSDCSPKVEQYKLRSGVWETVRVADCWVTGQPHSSPTDTGRIRSPKNSSGPTSSR
jgi:hypothetical protein